MGPGTLPALALFTALLLFSWMEQHLESRFPSLLRWVVGTPLPIFSAAYGTALFFILVGAGDATTFIYQRF